MNVARSVSEVLSQHTTLALECVDRMYLNVYVPLLQTAAGAAHFFRQVRGAAWPSSVLMAPITERFVNAIKSYAARNGIDLVTFRRGERKDERTREYLRTWPGGEGVLYIGRAQEKARVLRTERRHDPRTGASYPLQRQAVYQRARISEAPADEAGHRVRGARQRHPAVRRPPPHAAAGGHPDGGAGGRAAAQVAGAAAASVRGPRPAAGHPLRRLDSAGGVRSDRGLRPTGAGAGLLRRGAAREPRHGPPRPRAVDLRPARHPTHPSRYRTRVITDRVTPSLHVDYKHSRIKQYHKEGRALRTETGRVDDWRGGGRRMGVAVPGGFRRCRCLTPRRGSVSSRRSSVGSRAGAPPVGGRWMLRRFRSGPQSGSRGHVSSSRLVKPSVPFSGTGLSCCLHRKG